MNDDSVDTSAYNAIDHAKMSIAPGAKLEDWSLKNAADTNANANANGTVNDNSLMGISTMSIDIVNDRSVAIEIGQEDNDKTACTTSTTSRRNSRTRNTSRTRRVFQDNVPRISGASFATNDVHGDSLPSTPTVLTGLLDDWCQSTGGISSWSVEGLAARTPNTQKVSLDGGPSFARMSMCTGKVTMKDYLNYCQDGNANDDAAPLYIFDPDILSSQSKFVDGSLVRDAYIDHIPPCFQKDAMACINGTQYRPLPPAWLLVGVTRSGTPIHNHPLTVAWNALLVGYKLWVCLPPNVDEKVLLLNLNNSDDDNDDDANDEENCNEAFDKSALEWFHHQCCNDDDDDEHDSRMPDTAKIIVQRPGEVVFLPAGWFHVVLNVETSVALSVSLTLRRDLPMVLPLLLIMDEDQEFATFWLERLLSISSSSASSSVQQRQQQDKTQNDKNILGWWSPSMSMSMPTTNAILCSLARLGMSNRLSLWLFLRIVSSKWSPIQLQY